MHPMVDTAPPVSPSPAAVIEVYHHTGTDTSRAGAIPIGSRDAMERDSHCVPWRYGAIRATPSLPTQTGPAPPREDATRTSGVRVAAARARHAGAGPQEGRGPHARPPRRAEGGGRAGGRRARAARVELSSILGGLTACSRGTPAHLRQSFHLPSLHLGWKAAPRRLV
jgi:hypothetical protein